MYIGRVVHKSRRRYFAGYKGLYVPDVQQPIDVRSTAYSKISGQPCIGSSFARYELFSSTEVWSSDIRQVTDRQRVMHISPQCVCTGVLKNS